MPTVPIRQLADNASDVIKQVSSTGRPAIITNRGKPVAVVVPFDEDAFEDWVLSTAPQFVEAMDGADAYAAAGKGVSWEELR